MFTVSPELHTQIIAHNVWIAENSRKAEKTPEPVNPWMGVCEQMVDRIKDIDFGWGDHEEAVIFFLTGDLHAAGDVYDYVKARYKLGALDAQELVDRLAEYDVLRTEYSLY